MMKLLNGLAVSDIGVIREDAEIFAYKCQVELIWYLVSLATMSKKLSNCLNIRPYLHYQGHN